MHVIDHHLNHYHYDRRCVLRLAACVCVWMDSTFCVSVHTGACVNIASEWLDRGVLRKDWILYQLLAIMLYIVSFAGLFLSLSHFETTMKSKSVDWKLKELGVSQKKKNVPLAPRRIFVISFWLRSCFSNWLKTKNWNKKSETKHTAKKKLLAARLLFSSSLEHVLKHRRKIPQKKKNEEKERNEWLNNEIQNYIVFYRLRSLLFFSLSLSSLSISLCLSLNIGSTLRMA